jgi:hypothetical protein
MSEINYALTAPLPVLQPNPVTPPPKGPKSTFESAADRHRERRERRRRKQEQENPEQHQDGQSLVDLRV